MTSDSDPILIYTIATLGDRSGLAGAALTKIRDWKRLHIPPPGLDPAAIDDLESGVMNPVDVGALAMAFAEKFPSTQEIIVQDLFASVGDIVDQYDRFGTRPTCVNDVVYYPLSAPFGVADLRTTIAATTSFNIVLFGADDRTVTNSPISSFDQVHWMLITAYDRQGFVGFYRE